MGHRAFVCYEQENGTFNVHYSHWGATDLALCNRIDEMHPLGGENDLEPEFVSSVTSQLTQMSGKKDMEISGKMVEKQNHKCVEPTPTHVHITLPEVLELVENGEWVESLYLVENDFTVHGYHVEHLKLAGDPVGPLLVSPRWVDDTPKLEGERGHLKGMQNILTALVNGGSLTWDEAADQLLSEILNRFEEQMGRHVLAHSPVFNTSHYEDFSFAFVETTGKTRVLGMMVPTGYQDTHKWQLPDEFELPPSLSEVSLDHDVGQDESYNSFDSELPTVRLPLGTSGLYIEGDVYQSHDLPKEVRDIIAEYNESGGPTGATVYECRDCAQRDAGYAHGYLTTSDRIDDYKNPYTCPHTWKEETVPKGGRYVGYSAPVSWKLSLQVNGAKQRPLDRNNSRTYTLEVSLKHGKTECEEPRESVVIEAPPVNDIPQSGTRESFPSKTVSGEIAGKKWTATFYFQEETVEIKWMQVNDHEDDTPVKYVYQKATNEILGSDPSAVDTDADEVCVAEMGRTIQSRFHSRECGSSDFRIAHSDTLQSADSEVQIDQLSAADVPNSQSHLSRIQNEVNKYISQDELLLRIAKCVQTLSNHYGMLESNSEQSKDSVQTVSD